MPGSRFGVAALTLSGRGSIADDSLSHFSHPTYLGDSTSHFVFGEGDDDRLDVDRDMYGDVDASVRALRPRSSRRGSWESEASREVAKARAEKRKAAEAESDDDGPAVEGEGWARPK